MLTQAVGPWLTVLVPPKGGGSDGSAHGGDMSGCPSQQHWRRPLTAPPKCQQGGAGRSATATDDESQRGRGPRGAPRPTGTDPTSPGDAAGSGSGAVSAGGIQRHTGIGYEQVLNPVVPQMAEQLVEVSFPALAVEYISPTPAVVETIEPAQAVFRSQPPVVKSLAPAPVLSEAPALGGFLSPAPAVFRVGSLQGSVSQDRVPPLVVDMIFLSLLGGDAQMMRLAAPDAMDTSSVG